MSRLILEPGARFPVVLLVAAGHVAIVVQQAGWLASIAHASLRCYFQTASSTGLQTCNFRGIDSLLPPVYLFSAF